MRDHRLKTLAFGVLALAATRAGAVPDALLPPQASDVRLQGYVGEKIDLDLKNRVMAQDIEKLVKPFRDQKEVGDGDWRCEYWGKWYTSAVLACAYQPTPENRAVVDRGAHDLLATQNPDGYIGTRQKPDHLKGWDVWGRKYVLLGLLAYYDLSGDKSVLDAARRHLDTLLDEVGPGKVNLAETGYAAWKGLPPSSILEPTVVLYRRSGDAKYLDFARTIVDNWSKPNRLAPKGMRLIEDALAGVPAAKVSAAKAYEMTSCYEGLCELYRVTGERSYLDAAVKMGESIIDTELFIVGSGSSRELWFGGHTKQTLQNADPMETCVTATWMKYCYQLLRLTGEARWADQLEISLYNALLGALKPDGSWWGYYVPMQGTKKASHIQHADVGLSCCVVNGPRALMLTPQWAVMTDKTGPVVNLYCRGTATVALASGQRVTIAQDTDYPKTAPINLTVTPERPAEFTLKLRIPAWSERTTLTVNGKPVDAALKPGTYAAVTRRWQRGDKVALTLDLRGRVVSDPGNSGQIAVTRGPLVLSSDRRLTLDETHTGLTLQQNAANFVELTPVPPPEGIWTAFSAPCVAADGAKTTLMLCDYASAGNTWSKASEFRVWLPQPWEGFATNGLEGAHWIWFAGDHATAPTDPMAPAAPAGTRYFRKTVELPAGAKLQRATLRLTADDEYKLYVNGTEIGQGKRWQDAQTFDLAAKLQPGRNVVAVAVTNTTASPAGLVARLDITPATGQPLRIVTDATWKSTDNPAADWPTPPFDDGAWPAAQVLGDFGIPPWGALE